MLRSNVPNLLATGVDRIFTGVAQVDGTATITVQTVPAGLLWIVQQISVSTNVFRVGATCVIKRNQAFVTNTALGSADSAYHEPALLLSATDMLVAQWTGLTAGDQAQLVLFLDEIPWTENPRPSGVV